MVLENISHTFSVGVTGYHLDAARGVRLFSPSAPYTLGVEFPLVVGPPQFPDSLSLRHLYPVVFGLATAGLL